MDYPVTLLTVLIAFASQIWAFVRLNPQTCFGDEVEYLTGCPPRRCGDPAWVRVPLWGWAIRACRSVWHDRPAAPRLLNCAVTIASVALATGFAEAVGGPIAALLTAAMLLLSAERVLLALHLWPDVAMVFWRTKGALRKRALSTRRTKTRPRATGLMVMSMTASIRPKTSSRYPIRRLVKP